MTITLARTSTRNASLSEIVGILREQHPRKTDVVAPVQNIHAAGGRLIIEGADYDLTPDGVTRKQAEYRLTDVCESGVAEKLGIPVGYLRKTRTEAPHLWDANVNGWLSHHSRADKSFMVRTLTPAQGEDTGTARAFLSPSYRIIDNLDILTAALQGVRDAGVEVRLDKCDLTDRKMYVKITAPQVSAYAPELLKDYRSPFSGARGADNPTVFAGFEISNSETGCGAFTIVPRLVVQVCDNGMVITKDVMRSVHIGGKQQDGVIRWSDTTQARTLEVIASQTTDAVSTFLDHDYVVRQLRSIQETAATRVKNPEATITTVAQRLKFTEERRADIFAHFIQGGDLSAGGVMHAVTSVAQTLPDADDAHEFEAHGIRAMELAASL
ncbi:DUF932 domain-containing protein [Kitasatospora cineracea]|uniref:DUF932 domain-containing protein n=1 Tax=Kitasatospora cineracea TaxID=88074 RepID=A0A8G1XG25_9ACTN|nr:DUF932 domain-containing protein [Kitasatospora cineracea]ROR44752.1 hypothetical protein EDD39_2960 [Kitasatospora cineracea]